MGIESHLDKITKTMFMGRGHLPNNLEEIKQTTRFSESEILDFFKKFNRLANKKTGSI